MSEDDYIDLPLPASDFSARKLWIETSDTGKTLEAFLRVSPDFKNPMRGDIRIVIQNLRLSDGPGEREIRPDPRLVGMMKSRDGVFYLNCPESALGLLPVPPQSPSPS